MRLPDDRRSMAEDSLFCDALRLRWAVSDIMLVLMVRDMGMILCKRNRMPE
jgi:hypothetical protein